MPNIELHGFPFGETEEVVSKIRTILHGSKFQSDYVTSTVLSDVQNHEKQEQPYLRLFGTDSGETEELAAMLDVLNFDMEIMPPIIFRPKRS